MRILIIDDHSLFREAAALLLERLDRGVAVFEANNADEALRLAAHYHDLDLILLDLALPGLGGLQAIPRIAELTPATPIVVVSGSEDVTQVQASIEAGASGFVPKSATSYEFLGALRIVLSGEIYLPPRFLSGSLPVADSIGRQEPVPTEETSVAGTASDNGPLTPRQQRVLELLAEGLPNKLIARELNLSDATVKLHVSAILRELRVRNRTEAVVLAGQLGLLKSRTPS
jgi:DNA-binding NarL/FixJ family response regulator